MELLVHGAASLALLRPCNQAEIFGSEDVNRKLKLRLAAALAFGVLSVPAAGQKFSDSYTFLKAVRERDGSKTDELLARPSTAVLNAKDTSSGEAALHILTRGRDRAWLGYVLGKGARADIQNKDGETPLSLATQLGWLEGAELLLRVGANVDLPNRQGETPLMFAVRNADAAMVRLLMSKGANPKRPDNITGYSALDHAKQNARAASIVKLLEAAPAKPAREAAGPPR
jgi:ankyrin repeat protein